MKIILKSAKETNPLMCMSSCLLHNCLVGSREQSYTLRGGPVVTYPKEKPVEDSLQDSPVTLTSHICNPLKRPPVVCRLHWLNSIEWHHKEVMVWPGDQVKKGSTAFFPLPSPNITPSCHVLNSTDEHTWQGTRASRLEWRCTRSASPPQLRHSAALWETQSWNHPAELLPDFWSQKFLDMNVSYFKLLSFHVMCCPATDS